MDAFYKAGADEAKKSMGIRREHIGDVTVDSGSLVITDPAYLDRLSPEDRMKPKGMLPIGKGGSAVLAGTGGDMKAPVYLEWDSKQEGSLRDNVPRRIVVELKG